MLRTSLIAFVALAAVACRQQVDVDARLRSELDRLDASLKTIETSKLPADLKDIPKGHRARLEAARAATSPDVRLVRMREAFIGIELLTMLQRETRASQDFDALRTLWTNARARFEAAPVEVSGPLLRRAMAQNAYNRAQKLYRASLPYGKSSAPMSGLFYFAEAEGNLRFRDFLASLPEEDSTARAQSGAVQAELEELERETLKTFEADPSGRTSIRASARLKEARELYERNFLEGAALALVESRNASEETIPAALTALVERRASAAPSAARKPQLVTVTLVRWPYT